MTSGGSGQNESGVISEAELIVAIEQIIRETQRDDGYTHLSTIGSVLRERFPAFNPRQYGYKKLFDLIHAHADRFAIKRSGSKGSVWVGLSNQQESGLPVSDIHPAVIRPEPRLMTTKEFGRLCAWLDGPDGCNFRVDLSQPEGITWTCDGSLRMTKRWLRRRDFLHIDANIKVLKSLGGYCDCEVVFNACGKWPED